LGLGYSRC